MPAFLCSAKHISAIVNANSIAPDATIARFAQHHPRLILNPADFSTPEQMFQVLVDANLLSVDAKYGEGTDTVAGSKMRWQPTAKAESAVALLKLCDCYDYQSCEDKSYANSIARQFVDWVRGHAISALPGYDEAGWTL